MCYINDVKGLSHQSKGEIYPADPRHETLGR